MWKLDAWISVSKDIIYSGSREGSGTFMSNVNYKEIEN